MSMKLYQDKSPAHLKKLAHWLRNSSGIKVRAGIIDGQRKEYFKGKEAIKALTSDGYKKLVSKNPLLPKIESQEQAVALLSSLLPFAFFLRVDKQGLISTKTSGPGAVAGSTASAPAGGGKVRTLVINPSQEISPDHHYAWLIEAGQIKLIIYSIVAVSILFAGVLFPLWPPTLRLYVWYLSMGLLGLIGCFFGLAIIRLILFIITWFILSPGLWLFPNLFEDVGIIESFIPVWEWEGVKAKPKSTKKAKKDGKDKVKGKDKEKKKGEKGKKENEKSGQVSEPLPLNDKSSASPQSIVTANAPSTHQAVDLKKDK